MEPIGTVSEGEWTSLSGGVYTNEEVDFMALLLGSCPLPEEIDPSWPNHNPSGDMMVATNEDSFYSLHDIVDADSYHLSQGSESSNNGNILPTSSDQDNYYIIHDSHPIYSMELCMGYMTNNTTSYLVQGHDFKSSIQKKNDGNFEMTHRDEPNPQEEVDLDNGSKPRPKLETPFQELTIENNNKNSWKSQRKRSPSSANHAQSNIRIGKIRKIQKVPSNSNNDEENNTGLNGPTSSCYSDDDSSDSHEQLYCSRATSSLSSRGNQALNLNGKTRTSKGAATGLYAKKRRERINERLRILQNLVPNGTKVDISTMLEEAVQYVKFLQLQIKLLSSDELWMYAPIAYNGMDIGLNLKVPTSR